MRGLDPGIYTASINVFDGNQVVLRDQTVMRTTTVLSDQSGKILCTYIHTYITMCTYICMYVVYVAIVLNTYNYYVHLYIRSL